VPDHAYIKTSARMTDYKTALIKCYIESKGGDAPENIDDIDCWTYADWIDEICECQDINNFVRRYTNFAKMLIDDDDFEIFVLYRGTYEEIAYFIPSGADWNERDWNQRAKKYIDEMWENIFVIRAN
jgi:hypothetical protein